MLIDSHCHLDFPDFGEELDAVVERAQAAGVARMVTISTRVRRFASVLAIAEAHDAVFCSVGTHPHNAAEETDVTAAELVRLAAHPKVVAIGEAGLDNGVLLVIAPAERRLRIEVGKGLEGELTDLEAA